MQLTTARPSLLESVRRGSDAGGSRGASAARELGASSGVFPPGDAVGSVLVLRTAQVREVQRALDTLRERYPRARLSVLGRGLDSPVFDGVERLEIDGPWLTPRTYAPQGRRGRRFDLAVMCLNADCAVGYERVSTVMRRIPAEFKLVVGYTGCWQRWRHSDYCAGPAATRWMADAVGLVLYPLVALYLLAKPARPAYLPECQRRPAPRYEP